MSEQENKVEESPKKEKEPVVEPVSTEDKKHLQSVIRHIKNVQEGCRLLAEGLMEQGEVQFGLELIRLSYLHDNSKFTGIEWRYLRSCLAKEDENFGLAFINHVTTNPHHPEYWGGVSNMPPIYIAEMLCDWYARSIEFGTDLRSWIKDVAFEKYDIPPTGKVWKQLKKFLDILLEEPFT